MSNTTAILKGLLDTALVDTGNTTWGSGEKTNLIDWALAQLWPRVKRVLDPTITTVTLAEGTYYYALPTGVLAVSRVEWVDNSLTERGLLTPGSWEVAGDPLLGTGLLHVSPAIADQFASGTLRLHGYGRYDGSSHYIPDDYIQEIIAVARAEAYRRVTGDRARWKTWLSRQQTQNVSMNEALQMVSEAVQEAERLKSQNFTYTRPVPARV